MIPLPPADGIAALVSRALDEDVGDGDLTASLVAADARAEADLLLRENAVFCGRAWADAVFAQVDGRIEARWHADDGQQLAAGTRLLELHGPARALLTAERTAINFLQTLSGTATLTRAFVDAVAGTGAAIADTRKTLPGLRRAQKYAVRCGGGTNHRMGLYDAVLVKENHIAAAGGLPAAIAAARALQLEVPLMCEAENLDELNQALAADVDLVLVDDVDLATLVEAVRRTRTHRANGGRTLLEYSGGATLDTVRGLAETGVDRISVGALTKHLRAVDLSLRFR
jgi:nicotinate-nucleotide pyrophosphorylase [carboxylating] (EC 2.4.2.19)